MGYSIISFYNANIKRAWRAPFVATFVFGLLAHIYKFTNTLLSHDSLYFVHSNLSLPGLGRWLQPLAGALSSSFDLPWINGLLSLLFIALTAVVVVDLFRVENRFAQVLIAGVIVTCPSIVNTFYFGYSSDAYMMAMLMSALAVRLSIEAELWKHIAAVLVIMATLAVYQIYVTVGLVLCALYFAWRLLSDCSTKETLKLLVRQMVIFILGLLLYLISWKLIMSVTHTALIEYQGLGNSGGFSTGTIINGLKQSVYYTLVFFLGQNILEHGVTVYAGLNMLFMAVAALALVCAVCKTKLYKNIFRLILLIGSIASIPFLAGIFSFSSPDVFYHPLMMQSMSLVYAFVIILCDRFFSPKKSTIAAFLFIAIICKYTVHANECYHVMENCMLRSQATATELLTRVHQLDDGSIKRIAFINTSECSSVAAYPDTMREIAFSATQLRTTLMYDNTYSGMYIEKLLGSNYITVQNDELEALSELPEVEAMPYWPLEGSITVIGDTAVVKYVPQGE